MTGRAHRRRGLAASTEERTEYETHRRVAEGRAQPEDMVPNAVNQHPEWDWRPRVARPFEQSLFQSQVDALECSSQRWWRGWLFGKWKWWIWLADANRAAEFVSALKAQQLDALPEPERARCTLLLDAWLTKGIADEFRSLRAMLGAYSRLTLAEVHRREADAVEYEGEDEWLLCLVLRSMVSTMQAEGVLLPKLPSLRCPACWDTFIEGGGEERVRLVCFLPCSHWMKYDCWEKWIAANPSAYDSCPCCGNATMRAPVDKEYVGRLVSVTWRA